MKNVIFFENGNTAVFEGQQQVPELQTPWIVLFFEFLESKGIDPMQCSFELITGAAKPFRTEDGSWNWRV